MEKVEKGMLVTYIQKTDKKGLCPYHWVEFNSLGGKWRIKNAKTGGSFFAERDKILVHWLQVGTEVEFDWKGKSVIAHVHNFTWNNSREDLMVTLYDAEVVYSYELPITVLTKSLIHIPSHKIHLEAL